MNRRPSIIALIAGLALAAMATAHAGEKSDAKIKATATAKKAGADGLQTVTITLEIDKGWYIYANPINANSDVFDGNQTRVAFTNKDKEKIKANVKYPAGKQKKDGKYEFDVYQDRIVIQAEVQRKLGDTRTLQISIDVNTCRKGECLLPGTVILSVP